MIEAKILLVLKVLIGTLVLGIGGYIASRSDPMEDFLGMTPVWKWNVNLASAIVGVVSIILMGMLFIAWGLLELIGVI